MKKCVILSMDSLEGYEASDNLLHSPLEQAGWQVSTISWRSVDVDWNKFDWVMIRSTWDYQQHVQEYLSVLDSIDASTAHLDNPLSIVQWNIDKKYLRELSKQGIPILPTLWENSLDENSLGDYFTRLDCQEIVVKPCISAGAFDTYRISKDKTSLFSEELQNKFQSRDFMVQPFAPNIIDEGEFSLFFFDGRFSHCIVKKPKTDDFRVQEEFGGRLTKVEPEENLKEQAMKVFDVIGERLLYARLDFVRVGSNFALMEAELIEPSLYLDLDPESPGRFVNAMQARAKRLGIGKD